MTDTKADDKLLGYEYQFLYFLLKLLKLEKNEIAGFEVNEDVHTENGEKLILYQLKHTIQTNKDNKPINLSTSDKDLWKTLSLWIDKIQRENDKSKYLQNTKFIFISNKSDNENNSFLNSFKNFKIKGHFADLKTFLTNYLDELEKVHQEKKKTDKTEKQDKKIDYLKNVLLLNDNLLEIFFKNISFQLDLDDISGEIKEALKFRKSIKENRIDNTLKELIGELKIDFYNKVANKESVKYSGDDFYFKTIKIFQNANSDRLPFFDKLDNYTKDVRIKNRIFAKQLNDIGYTDEEIYEYDYNRNLAVNNLIELKQNGEISQKDIEQLDKNTIDKWRPLFEEAYWEEEYNNKNAKKVFINIKKIDLNLSGHTIEYRAISNGQFIKISDIPKIGWKYTWKQEYNYED